MAKTMTKKWNRAPFGPERVEEMERYLNKMSHEGWQCCEIVRDELRFVRGEQDEYIYRVQYFYESRDGEKDDYLRTLGETGAALVGEYGEVLILRKKTADGAFELYSDLDSKIAALEKRRIDAVNRAAALKDRMAAKYPRVRDARRAGAGAVKRETCLQGNLAVRLFKLAGHTA